MRRYFKKVCYVFFKHTKYLLHTHTFYQHGANLVCLENTTILQVIVCRVCLKRAPPTVSITQDRFLYSFAPLVQVLLSVVRGLEVSAIQVF